MWRYQLWQLGRHSLNSTEALKKCHYSSPDFGFKPPDVKHKGAEGAGNTQIGSSSKRCGSLSQSLRTRLLINSWLMIETEKGLSHMLIWVVAEHQIFTRSC